MSIELTFKQGATDWINSNERIHWAPKAERTRFWRNYAYLLATSAHLPALDRARIVITVHKTTRRKFDAHNLYPTGKAIVDGLVDAGVFPDDNNDHVIGPDMRAGEKRDVRQLVVTIEPLP